MYDLGVPISIVIYDYLPIASSGVNDYAQVDAAKELWPVLLEKAFSKLNGNYWSIVGGFPMDSASTFLGTGGNWYSTTSKTPAAIHADLKTWFAGNYIVTTGTISNPTGGIVGGHAYSVLGAYTLPASTQYPNGVLLVKLRNPWGNTESTLTFNDADTIWTSVPAYATAVGFVNKNDGDFFLQVTDFAAQFSFVSYNLDPTPLKNSYWLAINNADTYGVAGTSSYCGATCKRTLFTVTSAVAQTVYLSVNLHDVRQYVESPCTNADYSTASPYKYQYASNSIESWLFDSGANSFSPVNMTAGQKLTVTTEFDWSR